MKDDDHEVRVAVDAGCEAHEHEGTGDKDPGLVLVFTRKKGKGKCSLDPNLPPSKGYDDLFERDSIMFCVSSVLVDPALDQLDFLWGEEGFLLQHLVWEVNNEEIPHDGKDTGDYALYDEDPSPAANTLEAFHLDKAVGKN